MSSVPGSGSTLGTNPFVLSVWTPSAAADGPNLPSWFPDLAPLPLAFLFLCMRSVYAALPHIWTVFIAVTVVGSCCKSRLRQHHPHLPTPCSSPWLPLACSTRLGFSPSPYTHCQVLFALIPWVNFQYPPGLFMQCSWCIFRSDRPLYPELHTECQQSSACTLFVGARPPSCVSKCTCISDC